MRLLTLPPASSASAGSSGILANHLDLVAAAVADALLARTHACMAHLPVRAVPRSLRVPGFRLTSGRGLYMCALGSH
jgi:hypothetical protein